ncbi:hypothetical protein R3P38DRAFT_3332778 [Favolaschia claudopus]|uniref:Uncharacterized protein n=1 Tax=Favolaschia claudopus TaxID=2862362 RepID=A0AAV9ZKI6_9AGAR
MDQQNVANVLLQLLGGNTQPLLAAIAAGQAGQLPPPAPTPAPLPPPSTHPSVAQNQAPPAPTPTPSVPAIQPYQSLRAALSSLPTQLPPLPQLSSSSSASLNSVVNQARLSHAASSLPCQPALPRRRPRGAATAPPSLPRVPDISSCMTNSGNSTMIRTLNVIYPPQEHESESDLFFMRFHWGSFFQIMDNYGLIVVQTSDTTTSLIAHIQNLVHVLRHREIEITSSISTLLQPHENQPLAPLYVANRGVPRPSDNQIRLRRSPVQPTATLGELAANRVQFAVPGLCIVPYEGQNHLVLHFVMRQSELTASLSLSGDGQPARRHHCLSQRIYTMFPRDRVHEPWPHADGDSSCGESDDDLGLDVDDDDDEYENENIPQSPTPAQPSRVLRSIGGMGRSHAPLPSPTAPTVVPFPSALWSAAWSPPRADGHRAIYRAATRGTPGALVTYQAISVVEAADKFLTAVGECVDNGDFTPMLSTDQSALPSTDSRNGRLVSSGDGVMREIIGLPLLFVRSAGFRTFSSGPRQRMIGIAGAVWSLMMIRGLAPYPIDPALLQFLLNDCDFNSLPGPTGNIDTPLIRSRLATWLGLELPPLMDRDQDTHDGIPMELLYRSCIGSELPSHLDAAVLARNFRLPCRNGFTLTRYLKGCVGGSDRFLANAMASALGALTLIPRLSIRPTDDLQQPIAQAMGGESLIDIISDYLLGSGIPCPDLFEEARSQGLFPDVVDLSLVDNNNFRAQMLTWAVLASFLLKAAQATYPSAGAPSRRLFIHHWLLCQSLNGIAAHTFS